jgi:prolyl 4-hydroxylase
MDLNFPWISIEQNILTCPDGHRVRLHAYSLSPELAPQIVVLGGLLSEAECDELVSLSVDRLQSAPAARGNASAPCHRPARVAEHAHFAHAENPLIARIEARVAALSQWPADNAYGMRVTRCGESGEFGTEHHGDDQQQKKCDDHAEGTRAARRPIATVVMYLNNCPSAGAMSFAKTGLSVCPHKGNALFFNYPDASRTGDGRCALAALPIAGGENWMATKWLATQ